MKWKNTKFFTTFVCTASLALLAQFAQANPVTIVNAGLSPIIGSSGDGYLVDCVGGCEGLIGDPASNSLTLAEGYILPDSALATEMAFLATLTGGAFDGINAIKNDVEGTGFLTTAQWFSIKEGDWTAFFYNPGGIVDVSFLHDDGTPEASPYSHWTAYGPGFDSDVPLPAAAWLFGSALLGLITVARRR